METAFRLLSSSRGNVPLEVDKEEEAGGWRRRACKVNRRKTGVVAAVTGSCRDRKWKKKQRRFLYDENETVAERVERNDRREREREREETDTETEKDRHSSKRASARQIGPVFTKNGF